MIKLMLPNYYVELFVLILITTISLYLVFYSIKYNNILTSKVSIPFGILCSSILIWTIFGSLTTIYLNNLDFALLMTKSSFASATFIVIFYYMFARAITKHSTSIFDIKNLGIIISGLGLSLLSYTNLIVKNVYNSENTLRSTNGDYYIIYALFLFVGLLYPIKIIYEYLRQPSTTKNLSLGAIFFGSRVSIYLSITAGIILPTLLGIEIRYLGPLSLIFFLLFSYIGLEHERKGFLSYRLSMIIVTATIIYSLIILFFTITANFGSNPIHKIFGGVFALVFGALSYDIFKFARKIFIESKIPIHSQV